MARIREVLRLLPTVRWALANSQQAKSDHGPMTDTCCSEEPQDHLTEARRSGYVVVPGASEGRKSTESSLPLIEKEQHMPVMNKCKTHSASKVLQRDGRDAPDSLGAQIFLLCRLYGLDVVKVSVWTISVILALWASYVMGDYLHSYYVAVRRGQAYFFVLARDF